MPRRNTSVLPEPVTPNSRSGAGSRASSARADAATAAACAGVGSGLRPRRRRAAAAGPRRRSARGALQPRTDAAAAPVASRSAGERQRPVGQRGQHRLLARTRAASPARRRAPPRGSPAAPSTAAAPAPARAPAAMRSGRRREREVDEVRRDRQARVDDLLQDRASRRRLAGPTTTPRTRARPERHVDDRTDRERAAAGVVERARRASGCWTSGTTATGGTRPEPYPDRIPAWPVRARSPRSARSSRRVRGAAAPRHGCWP